MTTAKPKPRKPRVSPESKLPEILADWRTGEYTIRDLAHRHEVSKSFVANHTKGVEKDAAEIVDDLVNAKQWLAKQNGQMADSVHEVVDKRTKYIDYFDKRAVENVEAAFILPVENQNDCKARAETISRARVDVLGKPPETAVQINNNVSNINTLPPKEVARRIAFALSLGLRDAQTTARKGNSAATSNAV